MKRLAAVLLATTCLTAPAPARAEPISTVIGLTAVIASVGVPTAVAGAIGGAIISGAIAVGASLVSSALLSKPSDQASDTTSGGSNLSVSYGAALPRSAIMGPGAVGGHHVYTNVYGATNETMDCVFVIGDGQHGKLTALKYNGKDCTLPVGGLAHGVVYAVPEFIFLGTPAVGITYYSGRYDQVADANLIAHSNPPGRWTTDHRGRGVAYLAVHQVYAEGDLGLTGIPQLMIETEGLVLYDPRKDSTNGGSGPHRWGLPDTYEPSANPAVQEYNFRRGVICNGQRLLGMSMSPVNLILQMYFAAANINEEPIPLLGGGTEPRYRCSISVSDDRAASDVLSAMRASTAGFSLERGGQFGPVPGVPQIPISSLAFTDDDMIVGASARFTKYRSRSELVTATFGQFADRAQFWVSAAFPPREDLADDAAIGERIAKSLDLTQVYSSSQAQRIAESERRKTLQQGQGVATLPAKWIGVQPGDWLTYNSTRHGTMTVLVTGTTLDTARQQVTITYERTSNSVYSWTTAGELFPPDVGEGGVRGTLIMIAAGMTATGVNLPGDGGLFSPGIQFAWTPILDPTVEQIDFEIRKVGDTAVLPFTAEFPGAGSAVCSGNGISAATVYEYRHKLYTIIDRDTPWSAWLTVTSGTQHIVPTALFSIPGDVSLASFEAGLRDYVARQLRNGFERAARFEQLIASHAVEQDSVNWQDLLNTKGAINTVRGQVSTLTGDKRWRGTWVATELYYKDDIVKYAPDGNIYYTTADTPKTVPPAEPWVREFNVAFISEQWSTFAGPDGVAAQTSQSIEARFGGDDLPRSLAQIIEHWKAFAGPDYSAAQTSESVEARFGVSEEDMVLSLAKLTEQWDAFAGPDHAAAQKSESIEARFGAAEGDPSLPLSLATLTSRWQAFAGEDLAVAHTEEEITATLGENTAAVRETKDAIAAVDGKLLAAWTITLDVNGYISGIKAYNDGSTSIMSFITDIFSISAPSVGMGPTPVFQLATSGGIPKLVMRGDMIMDGTVTARSVTTGKLITIGAQIDDLIVNNIHIRGAAITVPGYARGGAVALFPTISTEVIRVTLTYTGVAGSAVTINAQANVACTAANSNLSVSLQVQGQQVAADDCPPSTTKFMALMGATSFIATGGVENVTIQVIATSNAGASVLAVASATCFGVAYLR